MSSLRSNFLWNSSFQLVRILTPLITTPYLARILGSEGMGVYSYTYAVANYACLFVLLGINQYGNREIAKARSDRRLLSRTFCSIFAMQLLWGTFMAAFYLIYAVFFSGASRLYALIWTFWVIAEIFDTSWFFSGLEEFKVMTIRNLFIRLFVIVGIFVFVRRPGDVWAYCLLQALAFVLSSAALLPMLRRRVDWVVPPVNEVIKHVKPNLVLFAPVIAVTFYAQANKIILGLFSGMSEVAFYDNADKISVIPLSIIQSMGTVMLPRMSRVRSEGDSFLARKYFDVTVWFGSILAFGFTFGIIAVSKEFVPLFFGGGFEKCLVLMPLLALIIPSVAWSNAFGVQWLLPAERDRQYLESVVVGAVVNIFLCILLIPAMGSIGAAIATVAAELAVTAMQVSLIHKELPIRKYILEAVPYCVFGILMLLGVRGIAGYLTGGLWAFLLEVLFGILLYGLMCIVWLLVIKDERIQLFLPKKGV